MGVTALREKRENQARGSEACRVLLESWGLQETQGPLGYQGEWAKKETLGNVQFVRTMWLLQKEKLCGRK